MDIVVQISQSQEVEQNEIEGLVVLEMDDVIVQKFKNKGVGKCIDELMCEKYDVLWEWDYWCEQVMCNQCQLELSQEQVSQME